MKWLIAIIATEAITEILVDSEILDGPRRFLSCSSFLKKMFECGYCMSFWAGLFVFSILLLRAEVVLVPIVFSRLSNFMHDGFMIVKKRRP
jgi:hypothetical protein